MKNKPFIVANTYTELSDQWHHYQNPWVLVSVLCAGGGCLAGLGKALVSSYPDLYVITALLYLLGAFSLYLAGGILTQRYVKGYCLDASFTLAPIDPAFPNGFKHIATTQLQIFRDGEFPLTPSECDIRLRIPIVGIGARALWILKGEREYPFDARCSSLSKACVFVQARAGGNWVIMRLPELVALITRQDCTVDQTVYSIDYLLSRSLPARDAREINDCATTALELFQQTKQIAKCSRAPEIINCLNLILHLTHPHNVIDKEQRKASSPSAQ